MKRFSMVVAASLMGAGMASAQSMPGFDFTGFAQVEAFFDGSDTELLGFGKMDMVFLPGGGVSSFPIGAELNARVLAFDGDTFHTVYGSVFADFGDHRVSIGWPESAFNRHGPRSPFDRVGLLDLELGIITNSFVDYIQVAIDEYSPGLRYDGEFGNLSVSASYHHSPFGPGYDTFGLGLSYDLGNVVLSAGAEEVSTAPVDTALFIGIEGEIGNSMYGVRYGTGGPLVDNYLSAYYDYGFNDRFTLGGAVLSFNDLNNTIYGIQAQYDFANNFYLRAGVFGSDGFGDTLGDIAVGIEF